MDEITIRVNREYVDAFRKLLDDAGSAIREAYAEAERTNDYSDADELAADWREDIHRAADSFMALLDRAAGQ